MRDAPPRMVRAAIFRECAGKSEPVRSFTYPRYSRILEIGSDPRPSYWLAREGFHDTARSVSFVMRLCPCCGGAKIHDLLAIPSKQASSDSTMFMSNPFAELSASVSPTVMQTYIVVMALLVVGGTLFDIMHKKSATLL